MRRLNVWEPVIIIVPLVAFWIVAVPANAEEPTGFGPLRWGTRYEVAVDHCTGSRPSPTYKLHCYGQGIDLTGSRLIIPVLNFVFDKGAGHWALVAYDMAAEHPAYRQFRAVMLEKFGPPRRTERRSYTTALGSAVDGEVIHWQWPTGTRAMLLEYCGRISESCLSVETRAFYDQNRELDVDERKRALERF